MLVDIALFGRTYDQQQWKHAFGLALTPARTNQDARESYNLYKWEYGKPPPNNTYGVIIVDPLRAVHRHPARPARTSRPTRSRPGMFRAPVAGGHAAEPDDLARSPRPVARHRLGRHATTPGSSGGTRTPSARTRSATVGKGLYEYTAGWASATRSTTCRRRTRACSTEDVDHDLQRRSRPQYAPPDYPSPAK